VVQALWGQKQQNAWQQAGLQQRAPPAQLACVCKAMQLIAAIAGTLAAAAIPSCRQREHLIMTRGSNDGSDVEVVADVVRAGPPVCRTGRFSGEGREASMSTETLTPLAAFLDGAGPPACRVTKLQAWRQGRQEPLPSRAATLKRQLPSQHTRMQYTAATTCRPIAGPPCSLTPGPQAWPTQPPPVGNPPTLFVGPLLVHIGWKHLVVLLVVVVAAFLCRGV